MRLGKILTGLILAFAVGANAATYYVDYAGGNDANSGTTTNAALKHSPGDSAHTGGKTLATGDTVIFKRGVTYSDDDPSVALTGCIDVTVNNVTFTVATNWGTGAAVFNMLSASPTWAWFLLENCTNVSILGLSTNYEMQLTGSNVYHGIQTGTAGDRTDSTTVKFCEFNSIGRNTGYNERGSGIKIGGSNTGGQTGATFESNRFFYNWDYGIKCSGSNNANIFIGYNEFASNQFNRYDNPQLNVSSSLGFGNSNIVIYNNDFHHTYSSVTPGLALNAANCIVYSNKFRYNGWGIGSSLNYNTDVSGYGITKVFNNWFIGNRTRGLSIGGTDHRHSMWAFNNVFVSNGTWNLTMTDSLCHSNIVCNNTFYGTGVGLRMYTGSTTNNTILNNAFYGSTPTVREIDFEADHPLDNFNFNLYWKDSSANTFAEVPSGSQYTIAQFATYQSDLAPREADSLTGNPLFVDTGAMDFRLLSGSACIDAGTNLATVFAFDMLGKTRGATWDIGAFEYNVPPAELSVIPSVVTVASLSNASPAAVDLLVFNSGDTTFTILSSNFVSAAWLILGSNTQTVSNNIVTNSLSFNTTNFVPGEYTGYVTNYAWTNGVYLSEELVTVNFTSVDPGTIPVRVKVHGRVKIK